MISPIWTAIVVGLVFIGMRLLQANAGSPRWLRGLTPRISLAWTAAAAIIGVVVIAVLDSSGAFRAAIGAPETPIVLVAAVLVLQVAVLLSVVLILRRPRRASP